MGSKGSSLSKGCRCDENESLPNEEKLQELINTHHDNIPNSHHEGCLKSSILFGNVELLQSVLTRGVNPNTKLKCGVDCSPANPDSTALHVATSYGDPNMVCALLENGADINMKNIYGESPLHLAASAGNLNVLAVLLQYGNLIKCLNDKSKRRLRHGDNRQHVHSTALFVAAATRKARCAEVLLGHGAKIGDAAEVCCALANKDDDVELMKRILSTGYSINHHRGYMKFTLLHEAVVKGSPDIVSVLLSRGAKVNARDRLKQTPLNLAITQDHMQVVDLLLAANAEVNIPDTRGSVPLHHAAFNGNPTLISMLLSRGALTDKREKTNYMMPHHKCLIAGRYQCKSLLVLLLNDCPIDAGSKVGSALAIAYSLHNGGRGPIQQCLPLLFSHGACDDAILFKLALVYENGVNYSWLPKLLRLIIHSGNDTADLIGVLGAIEQWFFAVDHKYYRCLLEYRRTVLSLKEYSRVAIRRYFREVRKGKSIWRPIEHSKLPKQLQDYLKLFDICGERMLNEIT